MAIIRAVNQKRYEASTRKVLTDLKLTPDDVAITVTSRGELALVKDFPGGMGFPSLDKPLARFNWSEEEWMISPI